jgi:hypothetical protein
MKNETNFKDVWIAKSRLSIASVLNVTVRKSFYLWIKMDSFFVLVVDWENTVTKFEFESRITYFTIITGHLAI